MDCVDETRFSYCSDGIDSKLLLSVTYSSKTKVLSLVRFNVALLERNASGILKTRLFTVEETTISLETKLYPTRQFVIPVILWTVLTVKSLHSVRTVKTLEDVSTTKSFTH